MIFKTGLVNKLKIIVFLTGFASMELEILGTRLLTPIFGFTIYVWTSLISVTLTLLAIGYYYGGRLADKGKITANRLGIILLFVGVYISLLPFIAKFILPFFWELDLILGPLLTSFIILSLPLFFLGFVVPSSVKLITKSLKEVGTSAGTIYSLATVGSIAGTLATGFFMITYLGLREMCFATGLVFILASLFLIDLKKNKIFLASILLLIPSFLGLSRFDYPEDIIGYADGFYSQMRVAESSGIRYLYMGIVVQSTYKPAKKQDLFLVNRLFELPFIYNPEINRVFLIGFGGGLTAKELLKKDISLDIVEIDPKTLDIAKEYFDWNLTHEIHFDDGRHFLSKQGKYDIIIMDARVEFYSWQLYTLEAFQLMHDHLTDDGVLIVPTVSARTGKYSTPMRADYKTLNEVFESVLVLKNYPAILDKSMQQILFFATKKKLDGEEFLEKIGNKTYTFPAGEGYRTFYFKDIVKEGLEFQPDTEDVRISTDNYPIVEYYSIKDVWEDHRLELIRYGNPERVLP